jgi:hypothetical protein
VGFGKKHVFDASIDYSEVIVKMSPSTTQDRSVSEGKPMEEPMSEAAETVFASDIALTRSEASYQGVMWSVLAISLRQTFEALHLFAISAENESTHTYEKMLEFDRVRLMHNIITPFQQATLYHRVFLGNAQGNHHERCRLEEFLGGADGIISEFTKQVRRIHRRFCDDFNAESDPVPRDHSNFARMLPVGKESPTEESIRQSLKDSAVLAESFSKRMRELHDGCTETWGVFQASGNWDSQTSATTKGGVR